MAWGGGEKRKVFPHPLLEADAGGIPHHLTPSWLKVSKGAGHPARHLHQKLHRNVCGHSRTEILISKLGKRGRYVRYWGT